MSPKPRLADGAFERAVRAAGVERLVCVGNLVLIIQALERAGQRPDPHAMILRVCSGTLADESWLRGVTDLVPDASDRVRHLDLTRDWFYVDDLAEHYCDRAQAPDLFQRHQGGRIFVPEPDGDGQDVLDWLADVGGRA